MTIASAKLPESQTQASGQAIQVVTLQDAVISCIIYAIGLVALCYGVLFIYGKFIQKKATK